MTGGALATVLGKTAATLLGAAVATAGCTLPGAPGRVPHRKNPSLLWVGVHL